MDRFGWNSGGRIPSRSRHVRRDAVFMATALPSNGALNIQQLWASGGRTCEPVLMKLGTQQQTRTTMTVMLSNIKLKITAGRHVGKYWKCHNSPSNGPTGMKLGWSHPITFPTCPPWCGCHGNVRCLATAHWTFCSYGRLKAERVNQLNVVHNSKLGPKWQSRDHILKFLRGLEAKRVNQFWWNLVHHSK